MILTILLRLFLSSDYFIALHRQCIFKHIKALNRGVFELIEGRKSKFPFIKVI
jgi:hypothetical protein